MKRFVFIALSLVLTLLFKHFTKFVYAKQNVCGIYFPLSSSTTKYLKLIASSAATHSFVLSVFAHFPFDSNGIKSRSLSLHAHELSVLCMKNHIFHQLLCACSLRQSPKIFRQPANVFDKQFFFTILVERVKTRFNPFLQVIFYQMDFSTPMFWLSSTGWCVHSHGFTVY